MSDQRIDDFRETHFPIEELGQTFCAEDSQHWPCDSGYVLDALAAAQATIAQLEAQVAEADRNAEISGAVALMAASDRDEAMLNADEAAMECNRLSGELAAREAQVAELTTALAAFQYVNRPDGMMCWCTPPVVAAHYPAHGWTCNQARKALAASQPAPAAETERGGQAEGEG